MSSNGVFSVVPNSVCPGDVLHFAQADIEGRPGVLTSRPTGDQKPRPHVCLSLGAGEKTVWASMTTVHRPVRLAIRQEWRVGGTDVWQFSGSVWLYDGAFLILAPTREICHAAEGVEVLPKHARAKVTQEGVYEILQEVRRQQHRVPEELLKALHEIATDLYCDYPESA